jgi:thiol-disulfide isomerase/thioredoxin
LWFFSARVTGRREGRKRRGCALLLCLGATTMAGDHGNVHVVNSKQLWETKVEDAKSRGKIIVVDFTATWCGPCRLMAPVFSDLSKKYDILIFLKVDVDEVQVRFFFFFLNFLFFNIHDHRQAGIALLTLISTMTSSSPQPLLLLLLLFSRTSVFLVLCDLRTETILHIQLLEVHCYKVHQIKENQMLLRHVHQILTCWMHTVCCHHHSPLLFFARCIRLRKFKCFSDMCIRFSHHVVCFCKVCWTACF